MGMCKKCGDVFAPQDMIEGYCIQCAPQNVFDSIKNNQEEQEAIKSVLLTTETTLSIPIEKRIDIISSQCIYGIMFVKDYIKLFRDIVGGRVKPLEDALSAASSEIKTDMKKQAFALGGNAVIGVRIEHTYNNSNNGNTISVFATGTAVKLANISNEDSTSS